MANLGLEVEIKPVITIDDETAFTLLRLLEMYCNSNGYTVKWYRGTDNEIYLSLVRDKEGKKNDD